MPCTTFPTFGLQRRQLVGGLLVAGAVQMVPWAVAVSPSPSPSASPAFMALSRYLTERDDLNPHLAARMQAALQGLDSAFATRADALWQWIDSNRVALADLNARLKADKPELAALPGQVMQAWYLGIVGGGLQTRVVAYEYALNAQLVSDKLKPPTYSYGTHGSWTRNPTTFNLKLRPIHA